ncbi:non-ribosomal peptide synthetase [Streptomyces sp. 1331.2]|uniref:non-ribosomal peptide synthetase n=1 Tax=Streptomyces sp. 1331.2 TaxID=1938835 RepID=UPI000BD85FF3|nr:non-ribosomal peptide synthetase [Streptomyces sp. 1331.2]SOB79765.1 amino acid adenylation domain-containing protein/thioester reductase domain-containing protein [Streptomyces sp. 1331.2]
MTSATQHVRSAPSGRSGPARSLPGLLARLARAHPDRPALSDGVRTVDYRTLDASAARIAARLAAAGTGRGDRVALVGPRDARMLVLLHGVLRSGAAAVLADPEWSAADLARRLAAVRVGRVLATEGGLGGEVVDVLTPRPPAASPSGEAEAEAGEAEGDVEAVDAEDPAYLSFTSGSSGEPKAVAVTHANAVHYALALAGRLGLTEADAPCTAHVTTLAADLGHTTWLLALATGGSVHVVPDREVRDPQAFWASLRHAGVNVLKTTPSHLSALLEGRPADTPPLHTLLLGGEALPRPLAAALLDGGTTARLANHYGPTETTVGATCLLATDARELPAEEPTVPIGTGIGEVLLTVVDGTGRAVPDGTVGELLIGGRGVSAGYFGRPDETARGFVRRDGGLVYRTGDLCRRRADGNLVFLGRVDRQVKVRGYRVDLAEIERAMDGYPGVARSAVLLRETAVGGQLLGAVRPSEGFGGLELLRAHLRDRLPGYSVPQPILVLPEFPVGPNGKLDRGRLGELVAELVEARAESAGAAATGPAATTLAAEIGRFWAGALGLPAVGPRADVLGLGGDSILAMRTIAFLRRSGLRVAYEDFYRHPTAEGLAAAAAAAAAVATPPNPATPGAPAALAAHAGGGGGRLAPAQRWLYRQRSLRDVRHWNQSVLLRCRAAVDPAALSAAVAAVLERHPALRRPLSPDGYGEPRPVAELDPVSFSRIPRAAGAIADTVAGVCTELHRSIDPLAGRLLRAHLFTGPPGTDDRLALIAHHLVVDGLSWRILLDDLAHAYRAVLDRKPVDLPPTADFYAWAAAAPVAEADEPAADLVAEPVADPVAEPVAEPVAVSWALEAEATARLVARHGAGAGLEAVLLAAFADAVTGWNGRARLVVEVETHGRDVVGDPGEFLDTVGWFTAVKHLGLEAGASPEAVARRLREAPVRPMDAPGRRPAVGFNFLGTFRLPEEPALDWTVAAEQAGVARCPGGDPMYELRLTARVVEQRLVADLVSGRPGPSGPEAERITAAFAAAVAAEAAEAGAPAAGARPVRAPLSTSGQLLHPGVAPTARATVREPARVLLTGATGYLGRHLLDAFLRRGAEVTCLVRAADDAQALKRLGARAVHAVAGDIDRDGLGLSPAGLERARAARIVVHAAADVRLVASPDELERTNHAAVRRLLGWTGEHTPQAAFHHVSTLAVSGGVDGPPRRFGEADLWIGQHFRTPYERTKYRAEQAVRAWAAGGHAAYLHRSGHIAAHSRTGAFQANTGDNRIYQLIRGYLLAGAAPSRPATAFAFSHVDTVAAGIAAIALDPYAAPGAYHVESPYAVAHDELVGWLAGLGHPVRLTDEEAFAAALAAAERRHPTAVRLAAVWAQQEERNVRVDSAYTTAVLDRLGVHFDAPTPQWWSAALAWAAEAGYLPPAGPSRRGPEPSP